MSTVLITPAAKRPVSIGEVKSHSLISHDQDDALIDAWISAAVERAQAETGRQLITATWDEYFDLWPQCLDARGDLAFRLTWAPLQSVTSVNYLDIAGVLQTLDAGAYRADLVSLRPRIVFAPTASLPSLADQSQAIVVRYVAGYGDEPHNVPEQIRQWIILRVATADAFREALAERAPAELPRTFVDGLLDAYRMPEVA